MPPKEEQTQPVAQSEQAPKELCCKITLDEEMEQLRKQVRRLSSRVDRLMRHTHANLGGGPLISTNESWD
jgi:hypothetical protein